MNLSMARGGGGRCAQSQPKMGESGTGYRGRRDAGDW